MEMKETIKDTPQDYLQSGKTPTTKHSDADTQHNCCRKRHKWKPSNNIGTTSYNGKSKTKS